MILTADTKGPLGILTAERSITIEDPAIDRLADDYLSAVEAGNTPKASSLRKQLLAKRFTNQIKPGQELTIAKPNGLNAVKPEEFDARIKWFADKDCLRVVVNVMDSHYAGPGSEEARRYRAYVDLFICPSGADRDLHMVHLLQGDTENQPYVSFTKPYQPEAASDYQSLEEMLKKCPVKATWKRTTNGYTVEAKIPYTALSGYDKNWTVMPVEAMVLNRERDWSYFVMTKPGDPDKSARSYSILTRN